MNENNYNDDYMNYNDLSGEEMKIDIDNELSLYLNFIFDDENDILNYLDINDSIIGKYKSIKLKKN